MKEKDRAWTDTKAWPLQNMAQMILTELQQVQQGEYRVRSKAAVPAVENVAIASDPSTELLAEDILKQAKHMGGSAWSAQTEWKAMSSNWLQLAEETQKKSLLGRLQETVVQAPLLHKIFGKAETESLDALAEEIRRAMEPVILQAGGPEETVQKQPLKNQMQYHMPPRNLQNETLYGGGSTADISPASLAEHTEAALHQPQNRSGRMVEISEFFRKDSRRYDSGFVRY